MSGKIIKKPGAQNIDAFISGAPDGDKPAAITPVPALVTSGRKQAISLTIDPGLLAKLDNAAGALGISRASAFSLAVARFVAAENREANQ
ncbi:MAG: CopG family transcriptional regulator [bacterium]|nr:CopG family transcriptional regulator [bacterium]